MSIQNHYEGDLPAEYRKFLADHPEGCELELNEPLNEDVSEIDLFGEPKLLESMEITGVGTAKNFECLKLFIQFQRNPGYADADNPLDEAEMNRAEAGFVIGGDYDGYLYLDPALNHSVWVYFPEEGSTRKVAESFSDLVENVGRAN